VYLKLAVKTEEAARDARASIADMTRELRIGKVHVDVIVAGSRPFREILLEASAGADIVFRGMAKPGESFREYYEGLQRMSEGLPTTAFVLATDTLRFSEVLVERAQ